MSLSMSSRIYKKLLNRTRKVFTCKRTYTESKNPLAKTWNIISNDFLKSNKKSFLYPEHVDIVIIGGGFIGSSVAYWLKTRTGEEGLSVLVLEKDLTYKEVCNNLSLGTITQHFSLPENVHLSQYSADFLRNVKEHLGCDIDIQYQPCSNLVLASEQYAEVLEKNVILQREYGLKNDILTVEDIKLRYPWLSLHDIKLGCIGTEAEGVFNSWSFLKGLVQKSQQLGANYVNAEAIGFELEKQKDVLMEGIEPGSFERINKVIYKTPDNEEHAVKFAACILAAGDESGSIAKLAKIGTGEGLLTVPLPIEKREYNVYSIEGKTKQIGLNTPIVMDTSGLWIRRNGLDNSLLFGHMPLVTEDTKNLSHEEYYTNIIKPSLLNRLPNSNNSEVSKVSTEKQDCNTYDDTGIMGPHPYHNNLYLATGFGKQGCLYAPGIGRAIAELLIDSHYATIDLTRLGFDRILVNEPLVESNVY